MKALYSDVLRKDYKAYMEPVLLTACDHMAKKIGTNTRSRYIRYAVIRALIVDGYPLDRVSGKFDKFYKSLEKQGYHRGIS